VLVPVKKLVNDSSVYIDYAVQEVTYIHLLFDAHEIVRADGLLSESFLPDIASDKVCPTQAEIERLFPQIMVPYARRMAARVCIQDKRAHVLN